MNEVYNENIEPKREPKIVKTFSTLSMVFSMLSIIYFGIFSLLRLYNATGNKVLSVIILIVTVIYAVIFVSILISRRRSGKDARKKLRNVKWVFNIIRRVLELTLTVLSVISVIDSARLGEDTSSRLAYLSISIAWTVFMILLQIAIIVTHILVRKFAAKVKSSAGRFKDKLNEISEDFRTILKFLLPKSENGDIIQEDSNVAPPKSDDDIFG